MKKESHVIKEHYMINFVKNNFSWVKDVVLVISIIGAMYLQGHYVTLDKFEINSKANNDAHASLISTMASMDKTLALMGRNQADITDLAAQVKINTLTLTEAVAQNRIDAEYNTLFKESASRLAELNGRVLNLETLSIQKFMNESSINRAQMDTRLKSLESTHPPTTSK